MVGTIPQAQSYRVLYVLRRNECAIEPVPNGQLVTAVATPVLRIGAVMQLMVSRTDEPVVQPRTVVHPNVPVA